MQEHKEQESAGSRVINAAGIPVAARGPLLILVLNKDGSLTSCKGLKAHKDLLAVLYRIHRRGYRKPRTEGREGNTSPLTLCTRRTLPRTPPPPRVEHRPQLRPAAQRSAPLPALPSPPAAGGPKGREPLRDRAACRGHPSAKSLALRAGSVPRPGPKRLVSGPSGIAAVVPGSPGTGRTTQGRRRFTDRGA